MIPAATGGRPRAPAGPATQHRGDFTPDEMTEGMTTVSADRVVFDVENVSTMRYLFVTLFHPVEVQSIYYLDRESDDVWRYYKHPTQRSKREPGGDSDRQEPQAAR